MALAIEYLYAYFTLRAADEADPKWPTMAESMTWCSCATSSC